MTVLATQQTHASDAKQPLLKVLINALDTIMTQWGKPTTAVVQDPRSGEKVDRQLWVTRKGATSAQKGQYGIIPGSMGVGSFITKAIPTACLLCTWLCITPCL